MKFGNCVKCQKIFEIPAKNPRKRYCSRSCINLRYSKREKDNCPTCGNEFLIPAKNPLQKFCSRTCARTGRPSWIKGKTTPDVTRAKQRIAKLGIRGSDHWNWRGGNNRTERRIAMSRDEYIQWRKAVFARDDFTCQACGQRGVFLHADHILPWSKYPNERYKIENGRTLCAPCHYATPTFGAKMFKELRS